MRGRVSAVENIGHRRGSGENELYVSPNGAVVQLASGDTVAGHAAVAAITPARVKVTDRRVVATVGNDDWSWALGDIDRIFHGRDAPWTILAVPGVEDHGVAVPAEDVDRFRAALASVLTRADVVDLRDELTEPTSPKIDPPPQVNGWSSVHAEPDVEPSPPPPPPSAEDADEAIVKASIVTVGSPVRSDAAAVGRSALAALEARQISAWFGTHHVLDRISLDMAAGQVTALIGPSGCGKSTFLRILNRMHEMIPSASLAGEVLLDGVDIYDPERRVTDARRQVGMVFQKPNPFPAMSIYDNVVASFRLTGAKVSKDDKDSVVEQTLRKAGLWNEVKDRLRSPGGGLSGGQQQRLCIARALAIRPRVLLMDEPCSALDPTSTRRIEQTIQELADEVTIVIVTHNMQQAARVSHQCAFFLAEHGSPGVIVEHGPTDAMFNSPADQRTNDYVHGRFG